MDETIEKIEQLDIIRSWNSVEKWQYYTPNSRTTTSPAEYFESFLKPCGGFKSPLSWLEKAELWIAARVAHMPVFASIAVVSKYSLPPHWQILLNYLYKEGVITTPTFSPLRFRTDFPICHSGRLQAVFNPKTTDGRDTSVTGSGLSQNIEVAYAKAVGELLERYTLSQYHNSDSLIGTHEEMRAKHRNPANLKLFNGFLPAQKEAYPWLHADERSVYRWTQVKNLHTGTRSLLPTQMIFWTYAFNGEMFEPRTCATTTSGSAGYFSTEKATVEALLELIQRDGFLIYWLNTLSPKRLIVEPSSLRNTELRELLQRTTDLGINVYFLDTTTDITIPACTCAVVDLRGEEPVIAIGASAGFDIESCLLSALYEALIVNQFTSSAKRYVLEEGRQPFSDVPTPIKRDERLSLWRGKQMFERFSFFISGEEILLEKSNFAKYAQTFTTTKQELATLCSLFARMGEGYEIYQYEASSSILTRLGYHVVRVVVPKLLALYLVEHIATLDAERLREVPRKLGYTNPKENVWPHPFP